MPLPDYRRSAAVLDRMRLGKQRAETLQLLAAVSGWKLYSIDSNPWEWTWSQLTYPGWARHPAAVMWQGYELSLVHYGLSICREWSNRGYRDTCFTKIRMFAGSPDASLIDIVSAPKPPWFGDPAFHASHRSNLLRKLPEHYSRFGWTESPDKDYIWPSNGST